MSRNILKVTTLAAMVAASFSANAALYNVYQSAPEGASTDLQTYGVAISPETSVCWNNVCNENTSVMATEVKRYREGFQYRDEAPFFSPFGWSYLDDNWEGFRSYCYRFLGYSDTLCERWATQQYTNGYANEQSGNFAGSIAYLDGVSLYSENTVVNSIDSGFATGNRTIGGTPRNVAFTSSDGSTVSDLSLTDTASTTYAESHAWKTLYDGVNYYTVGSVTRTNNHSSSDNDSKAAVWINGILQQPISWFGGANNGDRRAHASARDIIKDGANLYAVGYNSDNDIRFKATVFKSTDSGVSWTPVQVNNFPYDSERYLNQTLKAVNDNKIAIGTAKLDEPLNGAYSNTLFYVNDLDSPSYKAFSGSIFFSGANGKAGSINNHNDVVGTIDYDQHPETNGKPRGQRAFITNLGVTSGSAPIGGQARYLDDLTYGSGASSDNNQYRIVQAADINDAGVIAASAYYCAGGFESEAIDAKCSAGASLVGVKLVPINGQDVGDITVRPIEQSTVERQGGTLGFLALTLLGLLGFRRK